jgi:hypothetical protein
MPPKKGKAQQGGGMASFVSALPNLANPEEAKGQVVEVPGYYWEGGSETERSQIFQCVVVE